MAEYTFIIFAIIHTLSKEYISGESEAEDTWAR